MGLGAVIDRPVKFSPPKVLEVTPAPRLPPLVHVACLPDSVVQSGGPQRKCLKFSRRVSSGANHKCADRTNVRTFVRRLARSTRQTQSLRVSF